MPSTSVPGQVHTHTGPFLHPAIYAVIGAHMLHIFAACNRQLTMSKAGSVFGRFTQQVSVGHTWSSHGELPTTKPTQPD